MTQPIIRLSNSTSTPLVAVADASWDGALVLIDGYTSAPIGTTIEIRLPAGGTLPVGWSCDVKKVDPVAGDIHFKVADAGDRLNHYWSSSHPYGIYLNLPQEFAKLSYSGPSGHGWNDYHLDQAHNRGPISQLTIADPSRLDYVITPFGSGKVYECSPGLTGGGRATLYPDVLANWCPPSPLTGGNYLSHTFWVHKADAASAGPVIVASTLCGPIHASNDTVSGRGYHYLTDKDEWAQFYVSAGGVWLVNDFKPSFVGAS